MFDPSADPLGVGVQSRARDARWKQVANGTAPTQGPLPDQQWDGWFQALQEASGGKPISLAGGDNPAGSNQLTGFNTNGAVGTETYNGSPRAVGHGLREAGAAPGDDASYAASYTPYAGSDLQQGIDANLSSRVPGTESPRSKALKVANSLSALQNARGVQ